MVACTSDRFVVGVAVTLLDCGCTPTGKVTEVAPIVFFVLWSARRTEGGLKPQSKGLCGSGSHTKCRSLGAAVPCLQAIQLVPCERFPGPRSGARQVHKGFCFLNTSAGKDIIQMKSVGPATRSAAAEGLWCTTFADAFERHAVGTQACLCVRMRHRGESVGFARECGTPCLLPRPLVLHVRPQRVKTLEGRR
jgi:hypothetical protein